MTDMEKVILTEDAKAKINNAIDKNDLPKISSRDRKILEKMMTNEYKHIITESTLSKDFSTLGQIMMPLLRRSFPVLIGKDLVGIQPLSQPTGYVFVLRWSYVGNTTGNGNNRVVGGNTGHETTEYQYSPSDNVGTSANSLILIYNSTAARKADTNNTDVGYGDAPINGTGNLSGKATIIYTEEEKALVRIAGATTIDDLKALKNATGTNVINYYDNEAGYLVLLKKYPGPLSTLVGEQLGDDMSELQTSIDKIAAEAKTRKLKARYTLESAQDLKATQGKDIANELIDILTYEISQSIDRNIIDIINSKAISSSFDVNNADGRWQLEKFRAIYTELVRKSNDIAKTTMRGPGNKILCSPDVATALEQLPTFTGIAPVSGDVSTNVPTNQPATAMVGSLDGGRFVVYRDVFASSNYGTVVYKGVSNYDAGVFWAPYVPITSQVTINQENGNPNIIFSERSAIIANPFGASNYFRKINFSNIF